MSTQSRTSGEGQCHPLQPESRESEEEERDFPSPFPRDGTGTLCNLPDWQTQVDSAPEGADSAGEAPLSSVRSMLLRPVSVVKEGHKT